MEERKQENNFKFGIYLRNEVIAEKIFSADQYNPVVRYSVNIREMIPNIISEIQSVLQTNSDVLTFENQHGWNNALDYYKMLCDVNDLNYFKLKVPVQQQKNNPVSGKPYPMKGGTEFKFGLYINQHPIVERNFYVDGFNPEARFSIDFMKTVRGIVESLETHLVKADRNQMWDDHTLINVYDLNIQQVRELSRERREQLLKNKGDYNFVEQVRLDYNKQTEFAA